jgi:hypothetical protein
MGFGNGYVTRKWSVLDSPSRAARALGQAAVLCAGQAVLDRTVSGVRGRLDGFAAAADIPKLAFPEEALKEQPGRPQGLTRRLRRRFRLDKR